MEARAPSAAGATYTSWTVPPRPTSLPSERVKPSRARCATRSSAALVDSGGVPSTTTRGQPCRLRSSGVKNSWSSTSWSEEVSPVASKTSPLYFWSAGGSSHRRDAEVVERGHQGLAEPAAGPAAADAHGAGHQRVTLGVAVQPHRVGQPEVLGQQLTDGGVDQGLVAVAHAGSVLTSAAGHLM